MELNGDVLLQAPRERVWAALNDAAVLQDCIPGCEEVQDTSRTEKRARVMVKVGPVRARFQGRVTMSDIVEPERCVLAFEGSGGAAGMASGRSQLQLQQHPQGTRLLYTVQAAVGGKLGQIGGRMVDAAAKQLADQFFTRLRERLAPPAPVPEAPAEAAGEAASPAAVPAAVPAGPPAAPAAASVDSPLRATIANEFSRVLWFALGAASTGLGVWLGARLL